MNEIASLHHAEGSLWIGYGDSRDGRSGGLGRLQLHSQRLSSFTPTLTSELSFGAESRLADPANQPPRHPVLSIGSGPARALILNVADLGVRRYLPEKDAWKPLEFQEQGQVVVHSFAANTERLITGLSVARYDVGIREGDRRSASNRANTMRTNLTEQQRGELASDPNVAKRIEDTSQIWRPALGIHGPGDEPALIIADDGSIPAYPQRLALVGSEVIVAGEAYLLIYDLEQRRVRRRAFIPARSVDDLQVGLGFLWVQFEGHLYRSPLNQSR